MIPKRRMLYASLASAAVFMAIAALAGYLAAETPSFNADGSPDNAPIRAIGVLMILSPLLFCVVAGAFFAGGQLLEALGHLKPLAVAGTVLAASVGLAFVMVLDRPFGWRDQLHYFSGFAGMLLAALVPSTVVWWLVVMRPNKSLERTRDG